MDIKDAEDKIDQADSFLTKLWKFLGKHWGKLLIIGLCYCGYRFIGLVNDEMKKEPEQPTVIDQFYFIKDGDSMIVRHWSDGLIDTIN